METFSSEAGNVDRIFFIKVHLNQAIKTLKLWWATIECDQTRRGRKQRNIYRSDSAKM